MSSMVPWDAAQLLFIHVPKAAGTSFTAALGTHFSEKEICPAYYWSELFELPREKLLTYRLVRGHYEFSVTELLRDYRLVTVLRDPVSRASSYYRYIRSSKNHPLYKVFQHKTLRDVLDDPTLSRPVRDHQTVLFGRDLDLEAMRRKMAPKTSPLYPWENRPPSTTVSLERAMERLSASAFVGLQERFEDSLLLLAYTFGWPAPAEVSKLNVTPVSRNQRNLTEEEISAIEQVNSMDAALYRHAIGLFEHRYLAMLNEAAELNGCSSNQLSRPQLVEFVNNNALPPVESQSK